MDDARRDSIYQGYRLINIVGTALLVTVAAMVAFAVVYAGSQRRWPTPPAGVGWAELATLAVAAAVPLSARRLADALIARAARRGRGRKLAVAVQMVGWAAVGVWTSCQVPVLLGFALAFLHERVVYLVPFYVVSGGAAYYAVPRFRTWEHWFGLLEHPGKRTRLRSLI